MAQAFRFIHAADVHLDSPLRGLARYDGAPAEEIRGASRRAFKALIDLTLAEDAAFLLLAGDVFDGERGQDQRSGLFLASELGRLTREQIPVFIIYGNHDAASVIATRTALPEGVHQFSVDAAETVVLDDLGVAVHGRGFAAREVSEDLSASYPKPLPGMLNIGLLHTSADGRPGHQTYAPCSPDALALHGYDYWALGHIHQREVLSEDPWIVFPGVLQGRHIRETGAHGASVVSVSDGKIAAVEHRPLDVFRFEQVVVDAGPSNSAADVLESARHLAGQAAATSDRPLAVRVTVTGQTAAHAELASGAGGFLEDLRAHLAASHGNRLWLQKVVFETSATADGATTQPDSELLAALSEAAGSERTVERLASELAALSKKLPAPASDADRSELGSRELATAAISQAQAALAVALSGAGAE